MWIKYGQNSYNYDQNFITVSNQAPKTNYREDIKHELENLKSETKEKLKQLQK